MDNESLGNALTSTETATTVDATPDPAQVEQTLPVSDDLKTADSSLNPDPAVTTDTPENKEQESKAELDFKELRGQRDTLETELSGLRTKLNEYGGETHLEIFAPVLQKAMELPRSEQELDTWSPQMWSTLSSVLMPEQVGALQATAAWQYLTSPQGLLQVYQAQYGDNVPPEMPQFVDTLVRACLADPEVKAGVESWLRPPDETPEQTRAREASEARERARDAEVKVLTDRDAQREAAQQAQVAQQVMQGVFQVSLSPRDEVKKQFGLEYQKSDKDTPEITAFKAQASETYDELVTYKLGQDGELNQLANWAEACAKHKDERQRSRATNEFAPRMQQRANKICADVATKLANNLKLFSPELSDRAKAQQLKDLPAQVLGGQTVTTTSGVDLSDMPDATDTVKFQAWLNRKYAELPKGPAILNAG